MSVLGTPISTYGKTRPSRVFTSFQDRLTNSHINGELSPSPFHYAYWGTFLGSESTFYFQPKMGIDVLKTVLRKYQ